MKKYVAIQVLGGGSLTKTAARTGYTRQGVHRWAVDKQGHITSQHAMNAVLAALVRANYAKQAGTSVEDIFIDEATLRDLMTVPDTVTE